MQQAERPVPTVADAPQGSLIVILKDSTKSTWQFTRTAGRGLGLGDTHTHTPGRAHTGGEGPWPRMHTLTHMPTNNTHTPPPSPTQAQQPCWPVARAAWTWGMQPLGTLKHTQRCGHNTEACSPARTQEAIGTSSLHTRAWRAQRATCMAPEGTGLAFLESSSHISTQEPYVAPYCPWH